MPYLKISNKSCLVAFAPWWLTLPFIALKKSFLPNEPKLKITNHYQPARYKKSIRLRFRNKPISEALAVQGLLSTLLKLIQTFSKSFKAIQRFWKKKDCLFAAPTCLAEVRRRRKPCEGLPSFHVAGWPRSIPAYWSPLTRGP
jgi:hypothetical protein